jgi:pimeloyl-ACP methyl ester carboxylesterase
MNPLVLIHGHPFDRTMWDPQSSHFSAAGRQVVAPDLRGYGQSLVTAGAVGLERFAADLATRLDDLAVDRAVVCGLSMGGQIAMELAFRYPELVSALVLADTSPRPETTEGRAERRRVADRITAEGMTAYAKELLPRMVAPATLEHRPAVAAHVLRMMTATPAEGAAAALRGRAERRDHEPTLRSLRVPALVVAGDQDSYTSVAEAAWTAGLLPDGRLAVIPGTGHLPNLEEPAVFNAVLDAFLAGVETSGAETKGPR